MITIEDSLECVHYDMTRLQPNKAIAIDFIECPPLHTCTLKELILYVPTKFVSDLLLESISNYVFYPKVKAKPTYHPEIEAAIMRHRVNIEYRVSFGTALYGILYETGSIALYTFDRICLFHQLSHYSRCFLLKEAASFSAEEEIIAEYSALVIFKYLYKFNYAYIGNSIEYINKNVNKYIAETSANRSMDKAQALQNIMPKVLSCAKALLSE